MSIDEGLDVDAIVVGAGVGGAACALGLSHNHSNRVLLIERHNGPGNLNRGESLLPPVTGLLKRWGALHRVYATGGRHMSQMQFFHYRHGLMLDVPLSLPDTPDPYLVLPHPKIERLLVDTAIDTGRVEVAYRTRFGGLVEDNGRVCGAVIKQDGVERQVRARVVIGADGANSHVRRALGIAMRQARYNHSLFILDVDRPTGLPDILRTDLHPDGGMLLVPGDGRLGIGALIRRKHEHLFRSGSIEEKFAHIEPRSPALAGRTPTATGAHLYKLWRGHAPRYSNYGGVLLGDAVHVINPVMAQGMTMAIEDAAALARHLAPVLAGAGSESDLDVSFADYEGERRPFNETVIRRSHWMSRLFALGGPLADPIHRHLLTLAASRLGQGLQRRTWESFATSPEPELGYP